MTKTCASVVAEIEAMNPALGIVDFGMAGYGVATTLFEAVSEDPILLVNDLTEEAVKQECWLLNRPSPDERIMGSLWHYCLIQAVMATNTRLGLGADEKQSVEGLKKFWADNGTNDILPPL